MISESLSKLIFNFQRDVMCCFTFFEEYKKQVKLRIVLEHLRTINTNRLTMYEYFLFWENWKCLFFFAFFSICIFVQECNCFFIHENTLFNVYDFRFITPHPTVYKCFYLRMLIIISLISWCSYIIHVGINKKWA